MRHATQNLAITILFGLMVCGVGCSRREEPTPPAEPIAYQSVKPLLEKHCIPCHGETTAQDDINFQTMTIETLQANPALQQSMLFMLRSKQMPPNNSTGLTDLERETLIDWLGQMNS